MVGRIWAVRRILFDVRNAPDLFPVLPKVSEVMFVNRLPREALNKSAQKMAGGNFLARQPKFACFMMHCLGFEGGFCHFPYSGRNLGVGAQ